MPTTARTIRFGRSAHTGLPSRRRARPALIAAFLAVLTPLLLSTPWVLSAPSPATADTPAPVFSLPTLRGPIVTSADLAGRPAILLFGNTHCPHCRSVLERLAHLAERYGDRLTVAFIAVRQPFQEVLDAYYGRYMAYDVWVDADGLVAAKFGVVVVPTCIALDATGRAVYRGRLSDALADALVQDDRRALNVLNATADRPDGRRPPRPGPRSYKHQGTWIPPRRFIIELDEAQLDIAAAYAPPVGPTRQPTPPPTPAERKRPPDRATQARRRILARTADLIGARIIHPYGRWKNRIVVEIDPARVDRLATLPGFRRAKPDPVIHALIADTVPQIRADYAWDNAVTGQGVKVCVVDTGIDASHPDLLNKVVAQYDFYEADENATDDNGHGTHVAGIIASQGLTYRGISYDADLMAAKVLGANGDGYASDVVLGIQWCVEQDADVINLSLGEGLYADTCDDTEMAQAVNAAVEAGVVVVCAAGNDGNPNEIVSPACASKAIAVGAVDKLDGIASYSDGGAELDLVAPGGDQLGGAHYPEIVSTFSPTVAQDPDLCMYLLSEECYDNWFLVEGDRYIRAVGTSMAAPHVAAAAALLLEANPSLTSAQVKQLLESTAVDLGPPGWDNVYGWGRIDLEKALDNLPAEAGELAVQITDPNAPQSLFQGDAFALSAQVDCLGGDGCGQVTVLAEIADATDPNAVFRSLTPDTALATDDTNPADLGALSGVTIQTDVPGIIDVETIHEIADGTYAKIMSPQTAVVGSAMAIDYVTDDLEPDDGIGASGQDAQKIYPFTIPAGEPNRLMVQMEHFFVFQWDDPPAGWRVELCTADGTSLGLIGECIPPTGGGGEPAPPDCWFSTTDPAVLAALNPGGLNHLKLTSFGVGPDDHLAFNNIYVHVRYEIDPAVDDVHRYLVRFDLAGIDPNFEITAARLNLTVTAGSEGAVGQIHLADPNDPITADPRELHDPPVPADSHLANPIKTFGADQAATLAINIKAAVVEALQAGRNALALSIREQGEDRTFHLAGLTNDTPPRLVVSQSVPPDQAPPPSPAEPGDKPTTEPDPGLGVEPGLEPPAPDPAPGPLAVSYDVHVQRDVSDDAYTRDDAPNVAPVGSTMVTEFNTGDLEPQDGVGAVGEDAQKIYAFDLPPGQPEEIRIRMEHYVVLQFDDPPSRWLVYTSDPNGTERHLIGQCTPISGGGGEPLPPDCWFISNDPAVLADLQPGATNYIKLRSADVGEFDMLSFNTIEAIVRYPLDPGNDTVDRYYVQFDLSAVPTDAAIDAAVLNLTVVEPAESATAQVHLVDNYSPATGAYTLYNAADAPYSNLANPVKTFSAETAGPRTIQLRVPVEDALAGPARRLALLITEQDENARFTLAGSASVTPPTLDIYLKSDTTSGRADWTVRALQPGQYRLRVSAVGSLGPSADDEVRITIDDPNRPIIDTVECRIDDTWADCRNAAYGTRIDAIRVAARDPQQQPAVRVTLANIPDARTWIDASAPYDGAYFTIADANLLIQDSGQWQLTATAVDDDGNTAEHTITWDVPWGRIRALSLTPAGPLTAPKGSTFEMTAAAQCLEAECADVRLHLGLNEPTEIRYDDGSAEDYGQIGAADAYVAARITPTEYPAVLQSVRFYIYDETAYPFELHIWAADGPPDPDDPTTRMPGSERISPFVVYPVVAGTHEVRWFDVDLADYAVTLQDGDLYIGWRQLEDTRNNQVGFDTNSPLAQRTWAYLDLLGGWFRLDSFCAWDPQFCGNIMIRAVFAEPAYYRGPAPSTPAVGPVTVADPHPADLGDLKAGRTAQAAFTLYATGPVGDRARLRATAESTYTRSRTDAVQLTIADPTDEFHAANLDAVGRVDLNDLAILAADWLDPAGPRFADTNADGTVDIDDLAAIARHWLTSAD